MNIESILQKLRYTRFFRVVKTKYYAIFAKKIANSLYQKKFGRHLNWDNPTEFNEKLRYLQFMTDTSMWTILADKYLVRNYLYKIGGG